MDDYIYFIDLDDYFLCRNLANTKMLTSVFPVHYQTYKTLHPIYELDLDKVLFDEKESQIGFSSPRFNYITLANWHNNGLKIGFKENDKFYFYSDTEISRVLRVAELEIEFERVRRQVNQFLPSRLSAIYLANDNLDGRTMLKNMFYKKKKNFLIEKFKITHQMLFHKADYRWIEEYEKDKKEIYIYKYWLGIDYDSFPSHEYLLEGQIEIQSQEALEKIKETLKNYG